MRIEYGWPKRSQQAHIAQTTVFRAIEAYADVAKNRADVGTIATMAEFVYRPLKRKVEELRPATTSDQ